MNLTCRVENNTYMLYIKSNDSIIFSHALDKTEPVKIKNTALSRGFIIQVPDQTVGPLNLTYIGWNGKPIEYYDFAWAKNISKDMLTNKMRGVKHIEIRLNQTLDEIVAANYDELQVRLTEEMWHLSPDILIGTSLLSIVIFLKVHGQFKRTFCRKAPKNSGTKDDHYQRMDKDQEKEVKEDKPKKEKDPEEIDGTMYGRPPTMIEKILHNKLDLTRVQAYIGQSIFNIFMTGFDVFSDLSYFFTVPFYD